MKGKHITLIVEDFRNSIGDIARRTALPFVLFAAVLAALLTLSWAVVVPGLTRVEVGGDARNLEELQSYTAELKGKISSLQEQRSDYLFPVDYELYTQLKSLKKRRDTLQEFRSGLTQAIRNTVSDQNNAIMISGIYYDAPNRTIRLTGDVRNVGPRSMTVLARFAEELRIIPMTVSVDTTKFTRVEDAEIGFLSPFTFTILLDNERL